MKNPIVKVKKYLKKIRAKWNWWTHLPARAYQFEQLRDGYGTHLAIDTEVLFFQAHKEGEFLRYDVIQCYSLIEKLVSTGSTEGIPVELVSQFKEGAKKLGNDEQPAGFYLEMNEIAQGEIDSLTFALALYYKVEKIPIKLVEKLGKKGQRFEIPEKTIALAQIYERLCEEFKHDFFAIIWPPALAFEAEIFEEIKKIGQNAELSRLQFDSHTELRLVAKALYLPDDIEDWKIEKKLSYFDKNDRELSLVRFSLHKPRYRKKALNGKPLSVTVEELKRTVRSRFAPKISNYFHDIILHVGDNDQHTAFAEKVLDKDIRLADFLGRIDQFRYALAKVETPFQAKGFPRNYTFGKDLDLLCSEADFPGIVAIAGQFALAYAGKYEIREIKEENRKRIRFELDGLLGFQLDISAVSCYPFLAGGLGRRVKKSGYYELALEDELLLRSFEFLQNNNKLHHLDFLKEHVAALNKERLRSSFDGKSYDFLIGQLG